jgi:hypothetical protein
MPRNSAYTRYEAMTRFKTFSSAACGNDLEQFERLVNDWLAAEQPRLQHVAQSALGAHLVVSFVYLDGSEEAGAAAEAAVEAVAVPEVFEPTHADTDLDLDPHDPPSHLPEVELPY